MLPGKLPTIAGIELAAHYQTSARAGGDYYGIFELPHERWGLLLADISGHGAPAAVVTAMLHTMLRTEDVPLEDCVLLMRHLNQRLLGLVPRNTFATAFYAILSAGSLDLRYATAGHDPPRVRRAGSRRIEELELGTGLPLAISAGAKFIEQPARLAHGDQLVLYTDGITEAFAPDGEMFGVNRLDAALLAAHGHAPDTARTVIHNVDEFTHGAPPHDDRTLLVLAADD
jgi:sigma-B regulation protein RsbU (phosphoserine phosphatase)